MDCNIKVIARKRKFIQKETNANDNDIVGVNKTQKQIVLTNPETKDRTGKKVSKDDLQTKPFYYDNVFDENSTNEQLYQEAGVQTVDNVFQGYNSTMFAYGQTGSGKTYSIQGDGRTNLGMCYRALKDIFERIENSNDNQKYLVRCSFFEIYNEQIRDLIANKEGVKIQALKDGNIQLQNLTEYNISSYEQAIQLYEQGQNNRSTAATAMNQQSSRSHSIFQIMIESQTFTEEQGSKATIKQGMLSFVDLAGSEKLSKTKATGKTMVEGNSINLSLSCLKRVIENLIKKAKYIPYRDSILTHILRNSLGGNAKTLMLICVSPASSNYDETYSTLTYGCMAQKVTNKAKINEDVKDSEIRKLREQISLLEQKIKDLTVNGGNMDSEQVQMLKEQLQFLKEQNSSKIITVNQQKMEQLEQLVTDYKATIEQVKQQHQQEVNALNQKLTNSEDQLNSKNQEIERLKQQLMQMQMDSINQKKLEEQRRIEEEQNKKQMQYQQKNNQYQSVQQLLTKFANLQKYHSKINRQCINIKIIQQLIDQNQNKIYKSYQQLLENVKQGSQNTSNIRQNQSSNSVNQSSISNLIPTSSQYDRQALYPPDTPYSQQSQNPYYKYNLQPIVYPQQQQDQQGFTQAMRYAQHRQIPPKNLYHDPSLQTKNKDTVAMWLAGNGIIPPQEWQHEPTIQNKYGETVATLLADRGIMPPQNWMYDTNYQNTFGSSLRSILQKHCLPVPEHWHKGQLTQFDQACFGIQPQLTPQIKSSDQNQEGWTVAMILAAVGVQIPKCWYHDPQIQNCYGQTVLDILNFQGKFDELQAFENFKNVGCDENGNTNAMLMAFQGKDIPKDYYHDPEIRNNDGWTVSLILASKGITPDDCWQHDKYLRAKYCIGKKSDGRPDYRFYTVQNFLEKQRIIVPEFWKYKCQYKFENSRAINDADNKIIPQMDELGPNYQNIYGETVAIKLARWGIIPPQEWEHDPSIQDWFNNTVAITLSQQDILPPEQWYHNPEIQNLYNKTVALQLAQYQLPPKEWQHRPDIQNCAGQTVAIILAKNGMLSPDVWHHKPDIQDGRGNTVALYLARNNIIPPESWNHDPELHNNQGETVAISLIKQNKMPPMEWFYNVNFKNNQQKQSLKEILQSKQMPVPTNWDKYQLTIFDEAIFNQDPNSSGHDSAEQDKDGWTVSMIYVKVLNKLPPNEWEHDPDIKNKYGQTVANLIQQKYKPVPNVWYDKTYAHKEKNNETFEKAIYGYILEQEQTPEIQNCDGFTVAMCYLSYNYSVEEEWYHDQELQNKYGDTAAMIAHRNSLALDDYWNHEPALQNIDGNTVAMLQAQNGNIPLPQWNHDPQLQNKCGNTVAMILASQGRNCGQEWLHNPLLKNNDGNTVAILLAYSDIVPQRQWNHDFDMKNKKGESIKSIMKFNGYRYINGQFQLQ